MTHGFIDGRFPFSELTYRGSPEIRTVNWTENNKYQFLATTPSATQDENGGVWNHKVIVFNRDSYYHDTDVSNPTPIIDENTLYVQLDLAGNLYNKVPLSEFVGGEFKQYDNSVVGLKYDETTHVLDIIQNAPLKVDAIQYSTSNSKVHVYRGSTQLNNVDNLLDESVDLDIVNRTHNFDLDKTFDEQVTYVFGVTQYTDENETIGRRLIISPVGETTRMYIVPNNTTDKDYGDSVTAVMLQELSDFTWAGNALIPKINWKGVLEFGAIKADTDFDNVVWVYPLVETTVTPEALRNAVASDISVLSIDHEDTNTKRYVFDVDVHDAETDTEPQLDDLWWNIKIDDDIYTFNNGTRLNNRFTDSYPVFNTVTAVSKHLQYKYGLMVDIGDNPLQDIDVYFDPANSSEPIEHIIEIYLIRGDIKERAVKFSDKQLEHQLNAANIYTGVALNVDEFTGGTTHVIYVDSSSNESIPDGGEQEVPSGVKVWVQIAKDGMPFAIPLTENFNNELKAALTPYGIDVQDDNGSLRINHLPEAQFGTVPDSLTLVVSEASTYEEASTMVFNSFNYYCTMREPAFYANIQGLNIFTKHHIVIDYFNPNYDVVFKSDTYPEELVIPYSEVNPYEPNERVTQWFAERGYIYNQGTNPETNESGMSFSLKPGDDGEVRHFMNKIRVYYKDRTKPNKVISVDPISGDSYWDTRESERHVSIIATPHTPVTVYVNMTKEWE